MPFMPFHVPRLLLGGAISLAALAGGSYFLLKAIDRHRVGMKKRPRALPAPKPAEAPDARPELEQAAPEPVLRPLAAPDGDSPPAATNGRHPVTPWRLGLTWETGLLAAAGVGLLAWSLGGGRALALSKRRAGGRKPLDGEDLWVRRPDGTEIHVECYGPRDGTPILFIHGLGSDCDEWFEIRQRLDGRYRLIDWDLPGLGESDRPRDGDWSMEAIASDLEAVLAAACDRPAILLGHSLGGMILLTFCRLFPETLGRRVAGIVLAHTTYTNPMKTTKWGGLARALQWPLVEPICYLTIGLSPVVWPLSVLTYLSGEAHRSLAQNLFTGGETREVLDFLAHYFVEDRPESIARYSLAMLRYDETDTLGTITAPTLIVVGDRDDSCVPSAHTFMRDHIPGARLVTLSPAKHGGLLEHPREFTHALEAFVAECTARQRA